MLQQDVYFIRSIQVYDTTSAVTGANSLVRKKRLYIPYNNMFHLQNLPKRGQPKYYAMFGGATGESDTTSGRIALAPTPDTTYKFRIHFNKMPVLLER